MAGDWIKMRTNLDGDPRVIELAAALNIPELHVVGCLWKLWAWANDHSIDGNAIRVTHVTLDRYTSVPGFADALRNVGWLEGRDTALTFPRFAEHNGQTAKKRAETKERVAKSRNAKRVTCVTQNVLPEKRREEKRREESNTGVLVEEQKPHEDEEQPPPFREGRLMFDPTMLPLPDVLSTPTFKDAWSKWCNYLTAEKGCRLAQTTAAGQLASMARDGPTVAIQRIQASIEAGWIKLAETPKTTPLQSKTGTRKQVHVHPDEIPF
jgi:hypothetical protein